MAAAAAVCDSDVALFQVIIQRQFSSTQKLSSETRQMPNSTVTVQRATLN